MQTVRAERTSWRDEAISARHRQWGWDCPAVDIDFLLIEYDKGEPVALVEYKNEHARVQHTTHPSYQALIRLGDLAGLPVFACRYTDDLSTWSAISLNDKAQRWLPHLSKPPEPDVMSEREWVIFLYHLRGLEPPQDVLDILNGDLVRF